MSDPTPCLWDEAVLRCSCNDQILIHMENFSTSHGSLLPRAANLATLAVVVLATWWSAAQRPASQPDLASAVTAKAATAALPLQQAAELASVPTAEGSARWPVQAAAVPRDAIQAVGFAPRTQR